MRKHAFNAGLSVLCLSFAIACQPSSQNSTEKEASSVVDSNAIRVERGRYLAFSVVNCMDCHSKFDMEKFSIPHVPGTEGGGGNALHEIFNRFPGTLYTPNITPATLGSWTDEEIAKAITRGISKSGDTLFPMMPYHFLSHMAAEDVRSVIAFIRTLKPIDSIHPRRQLMIPMAVFGPLPEGDYHQNVKPDTTDVVKYGAYLTTIAHCEQCHTTKTKEGLPMKDMRFAGGNTEAFKNFSVFTANITPDSATGTGSWSEQAFIAKFRNSADPKNLATKPGKFNTYMRWAYFGTMTDADLKAIYAYLRTVPPVKHAVVRWKESD
jgi:mono/diheme cytochrome c family protein